MTEKKPTWKTLSLPFKAVLDIDITNKQTLINIPLTNNTFYHPLKLTKKVDDRLQIRYNSHWIFKLRGAYIDYYMRAGKMEALLSLDNREERIDFITNFITETTSINIQGKRQAMRSSKTKLLSKKDQSFVRKSYPVKWLRK